MMEAFSKIHIIGTSGSGKSTLAQHLSKKFHLPHIQLDQLYWEKNWTPVSPDVFDSRVREVTSADKWIVCGNYRQAAPIIYSEVELIIWLDYSLIRIYLQTIKRSLKRIWTKEELWGGTGNRETFRSVFLSTDSILVWIAKTYKMRKLQYRNLKEMCEGTHIKFLHFKSPKELDRFIDGLVEVT